MSNRIRRLTLRDHPGVAAAELRVVVVPEHIAPTTELRGRFAGPTCPFAATIEVAYPLSPLPASGALAGRFIVPEASLWEPECPFLYCGAVELWEDGRLCGRAVLTHGFLSVMLGPRGLRVNGRAMTLTGRSVARLDETEALALRRDGVNLLVAPLDEAAIWDVADRIGFFVIGRLAGNDAAEQADALAARPSCLGWVLGTDADAWPPVPVVVGGLVGVIVNRPPTGPFPVGVHFLACPAERAADLAPLGLPLLAFGDGPDAPGLFGRVT
jgi:hypothetical protein